MVSTRNQFRSFTKKKKYPICINYRAYEQAGLISKENKEIEQAVQFMERASFMFQEHGTPDTAALCLEKGAKYEHLLNLLSHSDDF